MGVTEVFDVVGVSIAVEIFDTDRDPSDPLSLCFIERIGERNGGVLKGNLI